MRNFAVFSLLLTLAGSIVGCSQREGAVKDADNETTARQQTHREEAVKQQEQHKHEGHQHAFADSVKYAKKWNDPARDSWQRPDEIVAALALQPGATVVDIGAGTGYMVAPLSKAVGQGGTVIAVDISAEMIEYLTKRKEELGPAKIMPRKVTPDDPALEPESVDGVMTLDTWHHIDGPESYAKKVYEGLKPGGRFVVVDYETHAEEGPPKAMRLAPGQVQNHLEAGGFRVEIAPESMPRHYMVVGSK